MTDRAAHVIVALGSQVRSRKTVISEAQSTATDLRGRIDTQYVLVTVVRT